MNETQQPAVHEIILQQLGGRKFMVMTGSKNLLYSSTENNWLSMHLTRNKAGAEFLKIILTPMDVYRMEFSRVVRKYETMPLSKKKFCIDEKLVIVKTIEPVYDDQLQAIFTEVTGLYTHF